jgi:S-adenosylmethionine:tRNA ribosyltransferase-isomerase
MIAADQPTQRPRHAKLLVVDGRGRITHAPRSRFVDFLTIGDLVIANDAATLPASLHGVHLPSAAPIEVRLAGRGSIDVSDVQSFTAIAFGAGDFRTRTEDRPPPPQLMRGDRLALGPLSATVEDLLGHPRLVRLRFSGSSAAIWEGLARHALPIQYAHMREPLSLWDVWTPLAAAPFAFEPPSAGFVLDWAAISAFRRRGIGFATITHAAGISSTGDSALDRRLPFPEPYRITAKTAAAIIRAKREGRRVVAIGTSVVRALEHAGGRNGIVRPGERVADQRIGPATPLRVVNAVLSGTHEPEGSHYQVLRAFLDDETLADVDAELEMCAYRTHEFGDSVLIDRAREGRVATAA